MVIMSWWDDFANNLASDLGPLISLFGESPTKQFLSEATTIEDIIIFSMAPIGILTAVVSAIRVCGSPSLRAFIGRAQEGAAAAEVEICSSTSRNVGEMFDSAGGVARVIGRPTLLEFVFDSKVANEEFREADPDKEGTAGIYRPSEYFGEEPSRKEWKRCPSDLWSSPDVETNSGSSSAEFAPNPNLSLNAGIKPVAREWYYLAATFGVVVQSSVLVWAAVARYTYNLVQSEPTANYAVLMTVMGTIYVCFGVGLCAHLVERSTEERSFIRMDPKKPQSQLYWIQPGGQRLGDQVFDPFAYTEKLQRQKYVTSWKKTDKDKQMGKRSKRQDWDKTLNLVFKPILNVLDQVQDYLADALQELRSRQSPVSSYLSAYGQFAGFLLRMYRAIFGTPVLFAVLITLIAFVVQFLGLRASHASVSVFQLGAMLAMSIVRALLRSGRLGERDNLMVSNDFNEFIGHELSWTAMKLVDSQSRPANFDLYKDLPFSIPLNDQSLDDCGVQEEKNGTMLSVSGQGKQRVIGFQNHEGACRSDEVKEWLQEVRRDVEGNDPSQIRDAEKVFLYRARLARITDRWEDGFVAGRDLARRLARAIEDTADIVFEKFNLNPDWKETFKIYWPTKCVPTESVKETFIALTRHQYSQGEPSLTETNYSNWKVEVSELEAVLALRLWALRSQKQVDNRHSNRMLWTCLPASDGPFTHDLWRGKTQPPIRMEEGEKTHTASLLTRLPLPELCAQETYSLFFRAIAHTFNSVGGRETIKHGQKVYIENENISLIQAAFVESGLGTEDDAWACIIPALITQQKLASSLHCTLNQHLSPIIQPSFPFDLEKDESARHEMLYYICKTNNSAINTKDSDGNTALHLAIKFEHEALALKLLEFNVDPNLADSCGKTPLFTAAEQDNVRLVKRLLTRGANLNQLEFGGNTPLHVAVEHGAYDSAKVLLCKGAEVDLKNTISKTPMTRAIELFNSCKERGTKILRLLLDAGADSNTQDDVGNTLMHTLMHPAAWHPNSDELVKMLLDKGADINMKNEDGETPLHRAAQYGLEEAVRALLNGNADPTIKTTSGKTPLEIAKREWRKEITKLLEAAETDWIATKKQEQLRSGSLREKHTKRSATDEGLRSRTF